MRILLSLLVFVAISASVSGQEKGEDDFLKGWEIFKKENAPFNIIKRENFTIEISTLNTKPKLGDLSYKRNLFTAGQEIIGAALHITAAFAEHERYKKEIGKDPAKYFLEGYY